MDDESWKLRVCEPSLTEVGFTSLYAEALIEKLLDGNVRVTGPLQLTVEYGDGSCLTCNLDNAWLECSNAIGQRIEICERYMSATLGALKSVSSTAVDPAQATLVPLIKCAGFAQNLKPESVPFAGDLVIVYAFDMPDGFLFASRAHIECMNMKSTELWPLATKNLARLVTHIDRIGEGPLYRLAAGGNYEASLLLLDEVWDVHSKAVAGDLVAAVPARDRLVFTGEESGMIGKMREAVREMAETSSHPISETLLVRRNNKWEVFKENKSWWNFWK